MENQPKRVQPGDSGAFGKLFGKVILGSIAVALLLPIPFIYATREDAVHESTHSVRATKANLPYGYTELLRWDDGRVRIREFSPMAELYSDDFFREYTDMEGDGHVDSITIADSYPGRAEHIQRYSREEHLESHSGLFAEADSFLEEQIRRFEPIMP